MFKVIMSNNLTEVNLIYAGHEMSFDVDFTYEAPEEDDYHSADDIACITINSVMKNGKKIETTEDLDDEISYQIIRDKNNY